jgi:hypothetical protein
LSTEREPDSELGADVDVDPDEAPGVDSPLEDDDRFPSVDDLIGSFLSESSLWPVLIVMLGSAGALGAALLVLTGVDRNPFAALALLLLAGMTLDVVIRARRIPGLRNVARMVVLIWGVAIALAIVAIETGIAG